MDDRVKYVDINIDKIDTMNIGLFSNTQKQVIFLRNWQSVRDTSSFTMLMIEDKIQNSDAHIYSFR